MKHLITAVLIGALLLSAAGASAMGEYTLTPATISLNALLEMTFGDRAGDARDAKDREYPFYILDGTEGRPFCGIDDTMGYGQLRFSSLPKLQDADAPAAGMPENIEPSGVARCTLTADEAVEQAEAWLKALGITDMYLQSITAYGRLEGFSAGYVVAFGQLLDGVPVYWAAATQYDEGIIPQSNRMLFTIGDSGLAEMSGVWSDFIPVKRDVSILSEQEALAAFAALGEQATYTELCYLLTGTQKAAKATPAYRYQNSFINAGDGTLLQ